MKYPTPSRKPSYKVKMGGVDSPNFIQPPVQIFTYLVNPHKDFKKPVPHDALRTDFELSTFEPQKEHQNFVYVYFWFAYHCLLAPFRFHKSGNKYEIHRWPPQQILCAIATALTMIKLATTVRSTMENIKVNDPISYFMLFCECSSFIFKTFYFLGFWRKAQIYLKLVRFMSNKYILPYNPYKMESITTLSVMSSTYLILSIVRMVFGSTFLNLPDWSPQWWYRRLVAEARYVFFLQKNASDLSTAPTLEEISFVDGILAIIWGLSLQFRFLTGFFADLCILMHVWSLWAPVTAFANNLFAQIPVLKKEKTLPFDLGPSVKVELDSVIKQYYTLKSLSILIGEAVGDLILPYIGEALFYYAIYFDSLLMSQDIITRIVLTFFYMSALSILMFSAEIVRKFRWLKFWLSEKDRLALIDQNQLAMMLDDMANSTVGVTASGIFTVNYNFVGTVVSVLITYFIIRLQNDAHL